ncbi:carbohydrate kinase [Hydrogenoanaerobacterium sp.]|uniref:carbohydrate kinase family protein n=1 Tax=Hydrogenoanaerobacterium sp. TaxID=2953763 RepID=UPI00289BF0EC|nr:carbohydrate kinase [Hydrogenoanaerobacterium sp.]
MEEKSFKYDIIAVGECLIDFVSRKDDQGKRLVLEGNPGGAPANVLAMAAKLGLRTSFISKLGQDSFGDFLKDSIADAGVDTQNMIMTEKHPTTLAFVTLDSTGNRSFAFYRNQTADVMLTEQEIDYDEIAKARVFHFGSVSMSAEPARTATLQAAQYAHKQGVMVSYDPNLRELLWQSLREAKEVMLQGMQYANVVKVSDEELVVLTGTQDLEQGMRSLFEQYNLSLLAVTMGPKGCVCCCKAGVFSSKTFDVACVDTTGAGDAFWGACLYQILKNEKALDQYTARDMKQLMDFSNAAGSLTTTQKGAIPAMPTEEQIQDCIANTPRCEV